MILQDSLRVVEVARAKCHINYVSDRRNQECRAFFEKPGRNRIRIPLFVGMLGQLNKISEISDSEAGLKEEKSGGVFTEEGECGDDDVESHCSERDKV